MANLSDRTRKQQVLDYLWDHRNRWVDGPALATEAVGGSEGLRRLRELRLSGDHDIRERRHPDAQRDIWQYMLVVADSTHLVLPVLPPEPAELDLGIDFDDSKPPYPDAATEAARREEEANRLLDLPVDEPESPWPADHGQTSISAAVKRKEDGTFEYVPPQRALIQTEQLETPPDPPQPPGSAYESMPKKVSWGDTAVCPRCKGKTTRGRKSKPRDEGSEPEHIRQRKARRKEGPNLVDSDGILLFRDPYSREVKPCLRCNGYGIVPNEGPIPFTPPTGPGKPEPQPEAKPMELDLD